MALWHEKGARGPAAGRPDHAAAAGAALPGTVWRRRAVAAMAVASVGLLGALAIGTRDIGGGPSTPGGTVAQAEPPLRTAPDIPAAPAAAPAARTARRQASRPRSTATVARRRSSGTPAVPRARGGNASAAAVPVVYRATPSRGPAPLGRRRTARPRPTTPTGPRPVTGAPGGPAPPPGPATTSQPPPAPPVVSPPSGTSPDGDDDDGHERDGDDRGGRGHDSARPAHGRHHGPHHGRGHGSGSRTRHG